MLNREEIHIRDPFILTCPEEECYYMYGTTALHNDTVSARNTFSVYKTKDLEHFSDPKVILDGGEIGFWADKDFWAPEVHGYKGKYYLFGSCKKDGRCRATQIFVCDLPDGKFLPISDKPITPADWECLDGTFYVEDNVPYMVFCHEWVQVGDGEIWAVKLADDLSRPVEEPFLLFRASDNPYVSPYNGEEGKYVTDGPFLYREDGKLKMIWSSFNDGRYIVLEAESDSIRGKWKHYDSRYNFDAGHTMLFKRLDGTRMISLHSPNLPGHERPLFLKY